MKNSLWTLMVSVQMILSIIIIPERANAGGPAAESWLEIYVETENTGGSTVDIFFEKQTVVWQQITANNFSVTTSAEWDTALCKVSGDYSIPSSKPNGGLYGFDLDGSHAPSDSVKSFGTFAFAKYKVTVSSDGDTVYFYLENRDSEYTGSLDINLKWNGTAKTIEYADHDGGSPLTFYVVIEGETLNIWDIKVQQRQLDGFHPPVPSSVSVTSSLGHPKIDWADDATSKFWLYRKICMNPPCGGGFSLLASNITPSQYTDNTMDTPGNRTLYYTLKAKTVDLNVYSTLSDTVDITGSYAEKRTAQGAVRKSNLDLSVGNNPNPFNPLTEIRFTLPNEGKISMVIYNIKGEEVERLIDGWMRSGEHSVRWDASGYASGTYFYALRTREETITGKMLYLK